MNQPLNVAVFMPFKLAMKDALTSKLLNTANMALSKKDAIATTCSAYQTAIIDRPDNAVNGFKATGLFPPTLANMTRHLTVYSNGGAQGTIGQEAWLKRKQAEVQTEARTEIPAFPFTAGVARKKARLTVDIDGELVSN
ncbi:hypothetical protein PI124_g5066 [Phytophthora idaei]|nr:hypothetical protein PI125_g7459 [Phytophthora idaei]KAG3151502.1 hypothetical protein PI126_g10959 [Phytophthora idaei]KAG3250294.1 hypothetical protein PI124_g5066 [Phytophthora idaei]